MPERKKRLAIGLGVGAVVTLAILHPTFLERVGSALLDLGDYLVIDEVEDAETSKREKMSHAVHLMAEAGYTSALMAEVLGIDEDSVVELL